MHNSIILASIYFLFIPAISFSQATDSIKSNTIHHGYIEKMDAYIACKIDANNYIESFEVKGDGYDYLLKPNTKVANKLSVNYRFISFSVGIEPRFWYGNNDNERKGKSKNTSLGLTLYVKNWVQQLSYQKTKGYYLFNSADYDPNWEEGKSSYIQFPELVSQSFSGISAYKFNKGYSLKSLFSQTERQLKSTGSIIPAFEYRYYIIDNKIALTEFNSSQKSNNLELALSLSYYHTYVVKRNFYLAFGALSSAGIINTWLLTRTLQQNYNSQYHNAVLRFEGQGSVGYNSKHFFAGAQVIGSYEKHKQNSSSSLIVNNHVSFQVFLGYRFTSPKPIDRWFDMLEAKKEKITSKFL